MLMFTYWQYVSATSWENPADVYPPTVCIGYLLGEYCWCLPAYSMYRLPPGRILLMFTHRQYVSATSWENIADVYPPTVCIGYLLSEYCWCLPTDSMYRLPPGRILLMKLRNHTGLYPTVNLSLYKANEFTTGRKKLYVSSGCKIYVFGVFNWERERERERERDGCLSINFNKERRHYCLVSLHWPVSANHAHKIMHFYVKWFWSRRLIIKYTIFSIKYVRNLWHKGEVILLLLLTWILVVVHKMKQATK